MPGNVNLLVLMLWLNFIAYDC